MGRGGGAHSKVSPSGRPISTSTGTRAGAGGWRPTARIPGLPVASRWHLSGASRGTIRTISRRSLHPSTLPSTAGPEPERHGFDAVIDERDLRETYLPAFEAAVREGGAQSVMCAYNRVDGIPACANGRLLGHDPAPRLGLPRLCRHRLRCGVRHGPFPPRRRHHGGGCGDGPRGRGPISIAAIPSAIWRRRCATGCQRSRWSIPRSDACFRPVSGSGCSIRRTGSLSPDHRRLAITARTTAPWPWRQHVARSCCCGTIAGLPLPSTCRTIAVIGPNADDADVLLGNYNGLSIRACHAPGRNPARSPARVPG